MIEMMDDNLINDITQDIIVEANLNYLFVFDLGLVEVHDVMSCRKIVCKEQEMARKIFNHSL